ncbi:MAG: hypothetical protein LBB17_02095 [Puniceicoccales bacterium]|nr:hypothetical protein [Puniceicoccales bacterium]
MSLYARGASFPPGELRFYARGVSFLPRDGQTVYGYEIDDEDNIIGYYLNGRQISRGTLEEKMAEDKALTGLNFEPKPLHGMKSLADREASSWFLGNPSSK